MDNLDRYLVCKRPRNVSEPLADCSIGFVENQ
jgi:hypothetical protein